MPRYAWEASLSTDLAEGFALRQWNVAIHGEKPFFRFIFSFFVSTEHAKMHGELLGLSFLLIAE